MFSQSYYVKKILESLKMQYSKTCSAPMDPTQLCQFSTLTSQTEEGRIKTEDFPYRKAIGQLLYGVSLKKCSKYVTLSHLVWEDSVKCFSNQRKYYLRKFLGKSYSDDFFNRIFLIQKNLKIQTFGRVCQMSTVQIFFLRQIWFVKIDKNYTICCWACKVQL